MSWRLPAFIFLTGVCFLLVPAFSALGSKWTNVDLEDLEPNARADEEVLRRGDSRFLVWGLALIALGIVVGIIGVVWNWLA